ncbi:MAG: alpha/beta hydrolase [Phenylobacterium sp.]|uniref:alpha/beta fold hydrolase n=1 Tax=Phenylobacterium sp. TaxID=1871053 RepID=UPI0011FB50BD|nr:alpha/beta hydrolase [Phenylobacterium sp.]TAL34672.1 MAG: alpha/beta hydrolase [Phenylobacterium sp.]
MPKARSGGAVEIEYEVFGDGPETILLINGLGSQMTRWPEAFCAKLVAKGYRAIRMDNRDTGLSTWFQSGQRYTLKDMAADAMAVLDAVGVAKAHIAGVSMGGMIVQRIAIDYPARVLSLTSIMSAPSGDVVATPEAMAVISNPPPDPAADYEAFIAHGMKNARTIGSPAYPWTDEELRARVVAEHARAFNPAGVGRQRQAIGADGDRTPELKTLNVPTVVLHGADDPLVQPVGGVDTANAIPGAELRIIPGMGHDLPPGLYDTFVDAILAAATRAKTTV